MATVEKSLIETATIKFVERNKKLIILVSDDKTEYDAIAIYFAVGSISSNPETPGVAHYLEHVIFEGSEDYEEDFQTHISEVGGMTNAYTGKEETVFMCNFSSNSNKETFKRFLALFKRPLMLKNVSEKEKKAVNNECEKDRSIEGWREMEVIENIIHNYPLSDGKPHPFAIFGCGNTETLKNVEIEDLRSFWENYKKVPICSVVYSKKRMEELLSDDFLKMFDDLETKNEPITFLPDPFYPVIGKMVHIKTIEDNIKLQINFAFGSYLKKPLDGDFRLIGTLLEHKKGLFRYLYEEKLVQDIDTGIQVQTSFATVFAIEIELTKEGGRRKEDVFKAVMRYLDIMRDLSLEDLEKYFETYNLLMKNEFLYTPRPDSFEFVSKLVADLYRNSENPDWVLCGSSYFKHSPSTLFEHFQQQMAALKYENCFVVFTSSDENETGFDQNEPYFDVQYSVAPMEQHGLALDSTELEIEFVPPSQEYVHAISEEEMRRSFEPDGKIMQVNICGFDVYHRRVERFGKPVLYFKAQLCLPQKWELGFDAETNLKLNVVGSVLAMFLQIEMADCFLGGNSFFITASEEGITLVCLSHEEFLEKIFDAAVQYLRIVIDQSCESPEKAKFEKFFQKHLQDTLTEFENDFKNRTKNKPYAMAIENLQLLLSRTKKSPHYYLNLLKKFRNENTQSEFNYFLVQHHLEFSPEILMVGYVENHRHGMVVEHRFLRPLGNLLTQKERLRPRINQFNCSLVSRVASESKSEKNYACLFVIDLGEISLVKEIMLLVFQNMVSDMYFQDLRTKQQMGYVCFCTLNFAAGNCFWTMVAQSFDKDPETIASKELEFVKNLTMEDMIKTRNKDGAPNAKILKDAINNVITSLNETQHSLCQVLEEDWTELDNGVNMFNSKKLKVEALNIFKEKISLFEKLFENFVESLSSNTSYQLQVFRKKGEDETDEVTYRFPPDDEHGLQLHIAQTANENELKYWPTRDTKKIFADYATVFEKKAEKAEETEFVYKDKLKTPVSKEKFPFGAVDAPPVRAEAAALV